MRNAGEIRHHIQAVQQTQKITNAMQLVSSSRMRRVMQHLEYNHRYFDRVQLTMKALLLSANDISHPYLNARRGDHRTYIVISGDKGMSGGYDANVLNFAYDRIMRHERLTVVTIGHIGYDFFVKKGLTPDRHLHGIAQDPALYRARQMMQDIVDYYDTGKTDQVQIIYTSFYAPQKNMPVIRRLLPIRLSDYRDVEGVEALGRDVIYDPSPQEVFDMLVPQYLVGILYGVLVQAYASEHYMRMNAMENASRNAKEILEKLKIQYNMARQAAITQEITEITGSAEFAGGGDTQ